jgi:hypothetical protein
MLSSQEGKLDIENWEKLAFCMASDGGKWEIRPC